MRGTRGRGEAGCPCRGSFVVRTGCFCRSHFGHEPARLQRTQAHTSRGSHSGCSRSRHAVDCEGEAAIVRSHGQCSVEGRRRTVGAVCLPVADRLGGAGDQHDLARKVGRPDCCLGGCAADPLGGSRGSTRQNLQLLLKRVSPGKAISKPSRNHEALGWLPPRRGRRVEAAIHETDQN